MEGRKNPPSAAPAPALAVKPVVGDDRPRCQAVTRKGGPCGSPTVTESSGGTACWFHDPTIEKDTKLAACVRGGIHATQRGLLHPDAPDPALKTPADITTYLEQLAGQVQRGELPSRTASALKSIAETALRAHEANLAVRLAELEELAAQRARRIGAGSVVVEA